MMTQKSDKRLDEMSSILDQTEPDSGGIDLEARGIVEIDAADLRARLKTFTEDWDRPEANIYDEDPPR